MFYFYVLVAWYLVLVPAVMLVAALRTKAIRALGWRIALGVGSVLIYLAIIAGILLPPIGKLEEAQRYACRMNLFRIGTAAEQYARSHDSQFPSSMAELIDKAGTKLPVWCPAPRNVRRAGAPDAQDRAAASDYEIFPGLRTDSPPDTILLYEKSPNHRGSRWAVTVKGDAALVREAEFRARIAAQEKLRNVGQEKLE